jgi:excinuclease ABC subunit A
MKDVGLGYLRLGQPATTLSGGEAQRLKICAEVITPPESLHIPLGERMAEGNFKVGKGGIRGFLYILDEPTIGLHFSDVRSLLDVLQSIVAAGNTVLIIEHNLDVIKASDWIVDLGPEGGDRGGKIIFEGTPEEIVKSNDSHTGRYLRNYFTDPLVENQHH